MTRLFVALEIPQNVKKEISDIRKEITGDTIDFKWEKDEKIHLTLKFIGEIKDEFVEPVTDSISYLSDLTKINCRLTNFEFFIKRGIPQILWIGLWVDSILFKIVERLNNDLIKFGVPAEDRKFKPHLTLHRIKKNFPEDWVTKFKSYSVPEINFYSDNILLMKSELLQESSRYSVVKKFKLK